jgi:hypothetical protein
MITSKKINAAVVRKTTSGAIIPVNPITLVADNNLTRAPSQGGSIEDLDDVVIVNKVKGATLVYDPPTNDYQVKPLDLEYITGDLDGGSF